MSDLKLGLHLGYWGAGPTPDLIGIAREAESLGYDSIWTAEAWGSDALTPLAWVGAHTERVRLGTAVMQLAARTPTAAAMAALTLDHLSNGRFILGLGVSGPQVVEGWYGQPFAKPVTRTRDYVDIVRKVLARDVPVTSDSEAYPLPYDGAGAWGLGKPLRSITHPLRADLPIFLGAEGPRNVAMTAGIADGWLPLYYSPWRQQVYAEQIAGRASGFEISATISVIECDDVEQGLLAVKRNLALYIGGMGAKKRNFHAELMGRMGFEGEARQVQELFLAGRRDEAVASVPSAFADEIALVGPAGRIRERLAAWRETPVTSLLVGGHSRQQVRRHAELILGA